MEWILVDMANFEWEHHILVVSYYRLVLKIAESWPTHWHQFKLRKVQHPRMRKQQANGDVYPHYELLWNLHTALLLEFRCRYI